MIGSFAQVVGFVLLVLAVALVVENTWPLFVGAGLLLIVPELAASVRRGDRAARR